MTEQSYERTWFSERRPCRRNAEGQGNDWISTPEFTQLDGYGW